MASKMDQQKALGYVDFEAVEMTPEQFEYITERMRGHTFSHERIISTAPSGESWWAGAQRLYQERLRRLEELTRRRHG